MQSRQGDVRVWHFSHVSNTDCPGGAESALHLAAKQLIADRRYVALPALKVELIRNDTELGIFQASRHIASEPSRWLFSEVAAERAVGVIRPDIAGIAQTGQLCAVEVFVRHRVDDEKTDYLRNQCVPSIEIDLRELIGEVLTFADLEHHVLDRLENKKWIHHPMRVDALAALEQEFQAWKRLRLAELQAQAARNARRVAAREEDAKRDKYEEANRHYRALPDDVKRRELRRALGLPANERVWPKHLSVPVREGAEAILSGIELWQGAIFARFVLNRGGGSGTPANSLSLQTLLPWVSQRFGARQGREADVAAALRLFLGYLVKCGFLSKKGDRYTVLHDTLTAPRHAGQMKEPLPQHTASIAPAAPTWVWRERWPSRFVVGERASEFGCDALGGSFETAPFLDALYSSISPPTELSVAALIEQCGGRPAGAHALLKFLGVVEDSWRMVREGVPPPWTSAAQSGSVPHKAGKHSY